MQLPFLPLLLFFFHEMTLMCTEKLLLIPNMKHFGFGHT